MSLESATGVLTVMVFKQASEGDSVYSLSRTAPNAAAPQSMQGWGFRDSQGSFWYPDSQGTLQKAGGETVSQHAKPASHDLPDLQAPDYAVAVKLAPKAGGVVRVGVARIHDLTGQYLPTENLRFNLMSEIMLHQFEAVALAANGQSAIAAEAAEAQCDYILYTEATQLTDPDAGGLVLPASLRGLRLSPDKHQALLMVTLYRIGKQLPELKQVPIAAEADQLAVNAVMAGLEKEAEKVAEQVKKGISKSAPASERRQ